MAFVLAHVSDLHASTFGDTFHDRGRIVRRSARIADVDPSRLDTVWEEAGWRVLRPKGQGRGKLALVDPEGYAHSTPSPGDFPELHDPVERAAAKGCRLEARRAKTLAEHLPSPGATAILATATPRNSNVRLLRAARVVEASGVDAVVITGDLTDDGDGYELVASAFSKFAAQGRLFAVPGNHDLYLFPISGSVRPRPTAESKRAGWKAFAKAIHLPELDPSGAYSVAIPGAQAVFVGLDSCARGQRRFFRHNGAIGPAQIAYLRSLGRSAAWKNARHRILALHHHVVSLPHGVGRRAPTELGMRLDDAREAAMVFNEIGATLVMHGHRHVSEERQPAGCNFRLLASPSLTLGCRSGDGPSFWRVELGEYVQASRVHIPTDAVEQDDDPEADEPLSSPELDDV